MTSYYSHPSAIIDSNVKIGNDCKIWHYCHISENVTIGENCVLGQNVFIGKNVVIGNNIKIQNNVSIFEGVILNDYVFCGPNVCFTNVINPRSEINKTNKFQETIVNYGASLGANSTIICGNKIGKYSFVGAGSVVTKEVKNFSLVFGNPARHKGWVSSHGIKLDLPLIGSGEAKCNDSNEHYILINNELQKKKYGI